ncbi:hypothetical protein D3C87_1995340 [compost metagenome]
MHIAGCEFADEDFDAWEVALKRRKYFRQAGRRDRCRARQKNSPSFQVRCFLDAAQSKLNLVHGSLGTVQKLKPRRGKANLARRSVK